MEWPLVACMIASRSAFRFIPPLSSQARSIMLAVSLRSARETGRDSPALFPLT